MPERIFRLAVSLCYFIADVAAATSAGDCCKGTAIAAAFLTADKTANHGTDSYTDWAILRSRNRLR